MLFGWEKVRVSHLPTGKFGFRAVAIVLFFSLLLLLVSLSGCLSRVDLYDMATTSKIAIKNGDEYLEEGTGFCDFGAVFLFESAQITLTVENSGGAVLSISSIYFVSGERSQFFVDASSLNSRISTGSSSSFVLIFTPSTPGYKTAVIRIESSEGDSFSFSTSGYGQSTVKEPDISVKQGSDELIDGYGLYDFQGIEIGSTSASVTFTLLNDGNAQLSVNDVFLSSGDTSQFQLLVPSVPQCLKPGESMTLTITFSPTLIGNQYTEVHIVNDDPNENPYVFSVTGYGEPGPEPHINVKQESMEIPFQSGLYDIGHTLLTYSSTPAIFTIENTGKGDLHLYSISLVSGDTDLFSVTEVPVDLVKSGTDTSFAIIFSPTTVGYKSAVVSIESNDPDENPYEFTIVGYGDSQSVPDISIPQVEPGGSYDFGDKKVGEIKTEQFKIKNTGTGDLTITSIILSSGDISQFRLDLSRMSSHIPPGKETEFDVQFNPTITGNITAFISIESNDPDEKIYTFTLSGYGNQAPVADIVVTQGQTEYPDGSTCNLGVVLSRKTVTLTITNVGTDELLIQNILLMEGDPDFTLDLTFTSFSLPPGEDTDIRVTFDPIEYGDRWRNLVINSNDPDESPYNIRFEGNY